MLSWTSKLDLLLLFSIQDFLSLSLPRNILRLADLFSGFFFSTALSQQDSDLFSGFFCSTALFNMILHRKLKYSVCYLRYMYGRAKEVLKIAYKMTVFSMHESCLNHPVLSWDSWWPSGSWISWWPDSGFWRRRTVPGLPSSLPSVEPLLMAHLQGAEGINDSWNNFHEWHWNIWNTFLFGTQW